AHRAGEVVRRLERVLRGPADRARGVVGQRAGLTDAVDGPDVAAPVDVERVVAGDEALLDLVDRERLARAGVGGAVDRDGAAARVRVGRGDDRPLGRDAGDRGLLGDAVGVGDA